MLLLTALAAASLAIAQGDDLIPPTPLTTPEPPRPIDARGMPLEGWVTVRYSVLADGTPTDVRAINVVPPSIDPAATLETVGQWRFSPGTLDSQAVDWHNNETVVVFKSATEPPETSEAFRERYEAVAAMIEAGTYDEALAANRNLLEEHAARLSDIGLALVQSAIIHIGRLDFHSALAPVHMATDARIPTLGSADLFAALQLRMQIEDNLGRVRDALASHDRLAWGLSESDPNTSFALVGRELKARWENTEILEVAGRLDAYPWRFNIGRRIFTIDRIEGGSVEDIDVECDTRKTTLAYEPEVDWHLPDAFGNCTLFVNGDPGTSFMFYELLPAEE
jgi:hypothetical protein